MPELKPMGRGKIRDTMILSPGQKSFAVAPMFDITDRHCRAFLRLFSRNFELYTEMKVVGSIIYGNREQFLGFDHVEHPLALQLGGCEPDKLAVCSRLAEQWGYDQVNLNIGCPSNRVRDAQFGACLMARPELVAECVKAMVDAVSIPVTVKTRIGIDDRDSYRHLSDFVDQVAESGCRSFIVHARKAWLKGLSPKQNRTIPPLDYDVVYRLKADFPELNIMVNGGICTTSQIETHLRHTDGIMMGREVYRNPWILREIDRYFFAAPGRAMEESNDFRLRGDHVRAFFPYIENQLAKGIYLRHITRHMLGLYHGQPGAKSWRRHLSTHGPKKDAGIEVIEQALKLVEDCAEDMAAELMEKQASDQDQTRLRAYA